MKKILILAAAAALASTTFAEVGKSTPKGFTDDFDAAVAASKKSGKPLFTVFTGSDWCFWCKKLEGEVLSHPEFVAAAGKEFELVFLDYPQDKSIVNAAFESRKNELRKKYSVRGYPTVMVIGADGEVLVDNARPDKLAEIENFVADLKERVKYAPLTAKYVKPYATKLDAALEKINSAYGKLADTLMDEKKPEAERKAAFKKLKEHEKELAGTVSGIRSELEKTEVPKEISGQKKELLGRLGQVIRQVDKSSKTTWEEFSAKKPNAAGKAK